MCLWGGAIRCRCGSASCLLCVGSDGRDPGAGWDRRLWLSGRLMRIDRGRSMGVEGEGPSLARPLYHRALVVWMAGLQRARLQSRHLSLRCSWPVAFCSLARVVYTDDGNYFCYFGEENIYLYLFATRSTHLVGDRPPVVLFLQLTDRLGLRRCCGLDSALPGTMAVSNGQGAA